MEGAPPVANQIGLFMHFSGASRDGLVARRVDLDTISSSDWTMSVDNVGLKICLWDHGTNSRANHKLYNHKLLWPWDDFMIHGVNNPLEHLHPLAATGTPTVAGPVPNWVPGRGSRQPPHRRHSGSRLPAPCKPKLGSRLPQTLNSAMSF
jgi:hypothetical protein